MVDSPRFFRVGDHNRTSHKPLTTVRKPSGCVSETHPRWHVVAVSLGHQFSAENELSAAGWNVFNPLHLHRTIRNPDRIVPLFPSYLFVRFRADTEWGPIRRVRYVWQLIMSAPGRPAEVPIGVVEDLQRRTSPRRIVDDPLHMPPVYKPGRKLRVVAGPLTGLEGICKLSSRDRVSLLFSLFGGVHFEAEMMPLEVLAEDP
jgi:transcription antitermination factor NusG